MTKWGRWSGWEACQLTSDRVVLLLGAVHHVALRVQAAVHGRCPACAMARHLAGSSPLHKSG